MNILNRYHNFYEEKDMNIDDPYFYYVVVFHLEGSTTQEPIIHERLPKENMHLLDTSVSDILPAIEFIMHLPRHIYDYYDLDEEFINSQYDTPHMIYLLPDSALRDFFTMFPVHPHIIIVSDFCSQETISFAARLEPLISPIRMKKLYDKTLRYYWTVLQPNNTDGYELLNNLDYHFLLKDQQLIALSGLFQSRQFDDVSFYLQEVFNSQNIESVIFKKQWEYMCRVNAYLYMKRNYSMSDYDNASKFQKLYLESCEHVKYTTDLSLIITMPGVPKEQIKYGISASYVTRDELRAIRIIGVHKAVSRKGVLIELERVSIETFSLLSNIEKECIDGTNNKHIWQSLKKLGKQLGSAFSNEQIEYIKRAKDITVFSDFPIGLAILGEDELPLHCYKAISYRPLSPLTRQLQIELKKTSEYYLGKGKRIKILFAECIKDDVENNLIFKYSETVFDAIKNIINNDDFQIIYRRTNNIDNMLDFIECNTDADILYISAHGHYNKHRNCAGIMVGDEFWMADQNIRVPPLVILSACHTSPRGIGAVNIADLFVRNGAIAVLSTFIPVNAQRNMIIMTRLFTYISEAQKGSDQYKTLSDLWNGIVITNALHEILSESKRLKTWMHQIGKNGIPRTVDFQLNRSVGRLRNTHSYSDTIIIIKEMLKEEGLEGKYSNILDQFDCFPESFFYQFIGSPENIFLYNDTFREAIELGLPFNDIK